MCCIIQARLGSSRLPGKVLLPIAGKSMLERVVTRASLIENVDEVIVATTTALADNAVEDETRRIGAHLFRGHPTDVLDRYYSAAVAEGADAVVRITADCPLIDPAVASEVVRVFLASGADYCSNILPPTFPDGLDTEVVTSDALHRMWLEAKLSSDREHVTTYIRRTRREEFSIRNVARSPDLSGMRWTVDEPADLEFMWRLVPELVSRHGERFGLDDVLNMLAEHPEIAHLNNTIRRNEGWMKSMEADCAPGCPGDQSPEHR